MFFNSQTQFPSLEGPKFNRGSMMLASAKEGLYHPRLPTFRRMDMDTVSQKLPYEHSRTTTNLTRGIFLALCHAFGRAQLFLCRSQSICFS
jgi:hypothetical protein